MTPEETEAYRLRGENIQFRLALDEVHNLATAAWHLISTVKPAVAGSRPLYSKLTEALEMLEGIRGEEYTNRRGIVTSIDYPNFGSHSSKDPHE